jgi:osmotically-inducible protein OsmY
MRTEIGRKLVALAGIVLSAAMVQAAPRINQLSPLEDKVRHELVSLPYLSLFDDVSFRVDGSTVTLLGEVTEPYLKRDAENAVKHIEGVTQVNDQIEVLPLSPNDNRIRWQTYRAIYGYPALQRYAMGVLPSIHIIVKDGNVTLKGVVSTEADRNLAYIRANGVPGAFSVKNELKIQG